MLKVGVTGGIGSGKTLICNVFKALHVPVFDSDTEAKKILVSNSLVKTQLCNYFGNSIYLPDGNINRPVFASIIFSHKNELEKANSIIHPVVREYFNEWIQARKAEGAIYVIQEAAILFESGAYKNLDKIITITANEATRIQRIIARDRCTLEKANERIRNQMNDSEKINRSNYVIVNNMDSIVLEQILSLHNSFLSISKSSND